MNNFSSYQGLPNLSYIVADDLDIANLEVDTIKVNTELQTDNIQPLLSTGNITIGSGTNTGIIDIQQDVDINANLEVEDITANSITLNTVLISPLIKTNKITSILTPDTLQIGDISDVGILDIQRNITLGLGKNLNISSTGTLLTPNINGLSASGLINVNNSLNLTGTLTTNGVFSSRYIRNNDPATIAFIYDNQLTQVNIGNSANSTAMFFNQRINMGTDKNIIGSSGTQLSVNTYTGVSPANSITMFNTTTGFFNIGNSFSSNNINFNQSVSLLAGKNLLVETIIGNTAILPIILFNTTTTANVSLATGLTSGNLILMNSSSTGAVNILSNLNVGTNASQKGISCAYFQGYDVTNLIRLFPTTNTGSIRLGEAQTTGNLTLGNTSSGSDSGTLFINKNTSIAVGKNLQLLNGNANLLIKLDASRNIVSSLYDETTLPVSTATQNALNLKADLTTSSLTNYTTTTNLNIALALKANINNPTFTGILKTNDIQPVLVGDATTIMTTSTSTITIGNLASISGLNINNIIVLGTGKHIYLPNTNQRIECNNFESFLNSNPVEMYRILTGTFKIGNTLNSNRIELYQSLDLSTANKLLYVDSINTLNIANNLTLGDLGDTASISILRTTSISNSKTLNVNTIASNFSTFAVNIFNNTTSGTVNAFTGLTSGSINISNVSSSGFINLNTNVVIPSSETLAVSTINSNAFNSALGLGNNITSNSISIGNSINNGSINLGNTSAVSCNINANNNIIMASFKNIELSSTCKLLTNNIESFSSVLSIGNNNTVNGISFGTGLTTANLQIASNMTTGRVIINSISAGLTKGETTIYGKTTMGYNGSKNEYHNNANGTSLFSTGALINKQLTTTMFAGAPTQNWNIWECDASDGETAFIAQNGSSTIISNPGDNDAIWWLDEDSISTTSSYAWVGFKFSTAGVMSTSSDRRVKRNIQPIVKDNLLDILSKIEFVTYKKKAQSEEKYYHKDGKIRSKYEEVHIGVVAQDVKKAGLDEVVHRENEDAFFTVQYQNLTNYFCIGVQELIRENIQLKEQVTKMDNFLKSKFPDYI